MGGKRWQDDEIDIVKQQYDPKKAFESCVAISKILKGRTPKAIKYCACKIGISRNIRRSTWSQVELDKLYKLAHSDAQMSITEMYAEMKRFWLLYRMPIRPIGSFRARLQETGYQSSSRSSLSIPEIAEGLRCSNRVIYRWLNTPEFSKVLKPVRSDVPRSHQYIKVKNFKKFAAKYPGEIASCCPDILWLVSILTSE